MPRPDIIDSRVILRGYRWFAIGAAAVTMSYRWPVPEALARTPVLPPTLWSVALLVSSLGLTLSAAFATGLERIEDSTTRQRFLRLFAATLIFLGLLCYSPAWPILRLVLGSVLPWVPVTAGAIMIVLTLDTPRPRPLEYFMTPSPHAATGHVFHERQTVLRSRYEEQIRQAARQEERARLARDLHDAVKQQLFVIQTAAATVETRFDSDAPGARAALQQVRASSREALAEMEVMLEQLQAAALTNAGLIESLRRQCEVLRFRTDADVTFEAGQLPTDTAFQPGAHQAMLRFAQEALANVARHARARHVRVSLDTVGEQVVLTVADDGQGFDVASSRSGMGLSNMSARAAESGGVLAIDSGPGSGTTATLTIPQRYSPSRSDLFGRTWKAGLFVLTTGLVLFVDELKGYTAGKPMLLVLLAVGSAALLRYGYAWWRMRE